MKINFINRLFVGLLTLCALVLPSTAKAEDIFAELSGRTHVESSYVAGRFAHNMKTWRSRDYAHAMDLQRGFSALYSYQCYSEQDVSDARKILKEYIKNNPSVELVMQTRQGMEEYSIYEKFNADEKLVQMVIWNESAPNSCEMVVIDWKNGLTPSSPKE